MPTTMRKLRSTENSVTYANPNNIGDTLKATTEVKQKNVAGTALSNVSTTFVRGMTNNVTVTGNEVADVCSIRVYISGSPLSAGFLASQFETVVAPAVVASLAGGCQKGFVPDNLVITIA